MHSEITAGAEAGAGGGQPEISDGATADKTYIRLAGGWHAIPRPKEMSDEMAQAIDAGR